MLLCIALFTNFGLFGLLFHFTGERGSSNVLFVKNLSFNLDEESLKDAFPNATTARIAKFPDTQKPKG